MHEDTYGAKKKCNSPRGTNFLQKRVFFGTEKLVQTSVNHNLGKVALYQLSYARIRLK